MGRLQKVITCMLLLENGVSSLRLNVNSRDGMIPASTPALGNYPMTMNLLEAVYYPHHPVMLQVDLNASLLEPEFISEWNGLKVPARFDCDNFNQGRHWGNHYYFYEVPSRWYACYQHEANVRSGLPLEQPTLPFVDDEYHEQVSVYQSTLRAKGTYNVVELGARWGTWAARSIAMLRKRNPLPYNVLAVEADKGNCEGLKEVMQKNDIKHELVCDYATPRNLLAWTDRVDHIDLIDMDIQGAEVDMVNDPSVQETLETKVYRLIIGTHSPEIHEQMKEHFKDWIVILDVPYQPNLKCVSRYLRGNYLAKSKGRFMWNKMIEKKCYTNSPRGKVANWDGELILDNPRFVSRDHHFTLSDDALVVDDLRV